MIRCVVFDFDGVSDDNYEKHFELSQRQITGLTREEHRRLFERNIHTEWEKLRHRMTDFDLKAHFNEYDAGRVAPEGVTGTLLTLADRYTLGIITSAKESGVRTYLEKNGLKNAFLFLYGFETDPSKVAKFLKVKEEYALKDEELVLVTDTLGDIREARKAGVGSIAVDFGYHKREHLEKGKPLAIVSQFSDIPATIESLI